MVEKINKKKNRKTVENFLFEMSTHTNTNVKLIIINKNDNELWTTDFFLSIGIYDTCCCCWFFWKHFLYLELQINITNTMMVIIDDGVNFSFSLRLIMIMMVIPKMKKSFIYPSYLRVQIPLFIFKMWQGKNSFFFMEKRLG